MCSIIKITYPDTDHTLIQGLNALRTHCHQIAIQCKCSQTVTLVIRLKQAKTFYSKVWENQVKKNTEADDEIWCCSRKNHIFLCCIIPLMAFQGGNDWMFKTAFPLSRAAERPVYGNCAGSLQRYMGRWHCSSRITAPDKSNRTGNLSHHMVDSALDAYAYGALPHCSDTCAVSNRE